VLAFAYRETTKISNPIQKDSANRCAFIFLMNIAKNSIHILQMEDASLRMDDLAYLPTPQQAITPITC